MLIPPNKTQNPWLFAILLVGWALQIAFGLGTFASLLHTVVVFLRFGATDTGLGNLWFRNSHLGKFGTTPNFVCLLRNAFVLKDILDEGILAPPDRCEQHRNVPYTQAV